MTTKALYTAVRPSWGTLQGSGIPAMPKVLQPHTAVPAWDAMSPGEKLAWLLDQALDCKREILTIPLPDPDDYSPEAHRIRALVLDAADSTIEQTIHLRTNQLAPAANSEIEKVIEERRVKAIAAIERMTGKPPKPSRTRAEPTQAGGSN